MELSVHVKETCIGLGKVIGRVGSFALRIAETEQRMCCAWSWSDNKRPIAVEGRWTMMRISRRKREKGRKGEHKGTNLNSFDPIGSTPS